MHLHGHWWQISNLKMPKFHYLQLNNRTRYHCQNINFQIDQWPVMIELSYSYRSQHLHYNSTSHCRLDCVREKSRFRPQNRWCRPVRVQPRRRLGFLCNFPTLGSRSIPRHRKIRLLIQNKSFRLLQWPVRQ